MQDLTPGLAPVGDLGLGVEGGVGVGLAEERVVDLARGERDHLERERRDRRGRRGGHPLRADRRDHQRALLRGVEPQQPVDLRVDEAGDEAGRQIQRARHGQELRQHGARVPEEVPVAARLVLPGIAPVDPGEDHRGGLGRDRVVGRGQGEGAAPVAGPQQSQAEVARVEVIDPGRQTLHRPGHHVHLGLVERAGGGGRPEVDLRAPRVRLDAHDAGREKEDRGETIEIERGRPGDGLGRAQRGEGIHRGHRQPGGQAPRLERRVDLERERLGLPVERVPAPAHRLGGMRGALVIRAGGRDVAVVRDDLT